MCVFVWDSIIIPVGGGAEIAQNTLPYVYICKADIPSPQITAAFPDVNSSAENVKDSTGSNFTTSCEVGIQGRGRYDPDQYLQVRRQNRK